MSGGVTDNVYARGAVSANDNVGGLVGEIADSWQLTHAYSTGGVEAANPHLVGGLIGNDLATGTGEGSPIVYSLYFDQQTAGTSVDTWATPKNSNQMKLVANQPTFEADPDVSEDINGFDFGAIWEFASAQNNDYPIFKWQLDPITSVTCEQAHMTATTGRIACDVVYQGGDPSRATPAEWTATRYRKSGDTDWIDTDWTNQAHGKAIFYNLDPGTNYDFSIRVNNNFIDQFVLVEGRTLSESSDRDNDSVLDVDENQGPNNGDVNNDGILDSEQANVTNFLNPITGKYVAVNTGICSGGVNGSLNSETSVTAEPTDVKDAGYSYPAGVMGFSADCYNPCCPCVNNEILGFDPQSVTAGNSKVSAQCCPCGPPASNPGDTLHTFTISQYWFGNFTAQSFVARKYNSVTKSYTTIPGATITNVVIDGQPAVKLVYDILDNGPLDEDPTVGKIKDPTGPALSDVSAPNTGIRGGRN